jgi:hypothetical protein
VESGKKRKNEGEREAVVVLRSGKTGHRCYQGDTVTGRDRVCTLKDYSRIIVDHDHDKRYF